MSRTQSTCRVAHAAGDSLVVIGFLALVLVGADCGRRGELLGSLGDAATPLMDGAVPGAPHFSPPQALSVLSTPFATDGDPTLTGDLLELFFTSNRAGSMDIWMSRRSSAADPWGAPVPVPDVNSPFGDYGPAVSLDGLRMWFTTDRDLSLGKIWRSSRTTRAAAWSAPSPVPEIASPNPAKDFSPAVDATETTMFFGSNRPGAAAFDVYASTRTSANAPWGVPQPVPGVNGPFDDWDPFVAQGGLVIFFTSMRQGAGDIFWSARQSVTEPFPAPAPLTDVNSAAYDSDPSLSQDLTYLVFDSTRSGHSEIYEAHAIP